MSKRLKKKSVALAVAVTVCALAMGLLLASMQTRLSQEEYALEFDRVAAELPDLVKTARAETKANTQTFDDLYRTRAASIAFMAANDAGYEATDVKMAELKDLLKVDNVLVARRDGSIIAKAADTKADFSRARFNQLRQCFETGKPSDPVEVDLPDQDWLMRYYAAKIDDDTMAIVEQNPQELHALVKDTGSTESMLKNISLGSHGFVLAVSAKTHLITYHPDQNMIGTDALDNGIDISNLEDGKHSSLPSRTQACTVASSWSMTPITFSPFPKATPPPHATSPWASSSLPSSQSSPPWRSMTCLSLRMTSIATKAITNTSRSVATLGLTPPWAGAQQPCPLQDSSCSWR